MVDMTFSLRLAGSAWHGWICMFVMRILCKQLCLQDPCFFKSVFHLPPGLTKLNAGQHMSACGAWYVETWLSNENPISRWQRDADGFSCNCYLGHFVVSTCFNQTLERNPASPKGWLKHVETPILSITINKWILQPSMVVFFAGAGPTARPLPRAVETSKGATGDIGDMSIETDGNKANSARKIKMKWNHMKSIEILHLPVSKFSYRSCS